MPDTRVVLAATHTQLRPGGLRRDTVGAPADVTARQIASAVGRAAAASTPRASGAGYSAASSELWAGRRRKICRH